MEKEIYKIIDKEKLSMVSETIEKAEVNEKKFNFLYIDGDNCHFMDNLTFEQVEIPKSITGEQFSYHTASFVDTDTDLILSSSQVYNRITGSFSASYQNQILR